MQNIDFKKSTVQFIILPVVILIICSFMVVSYIFYTKYKTSVGDGSNITIDAKVKSYMNAVEILYNTVSEQDVGTFQTYAEQTKALSSWVLKEMDEERELMVLASSRHPELIGQVLPLEICGIDKIKYQEFISEGYYKNVKLFPDNKAKICYFKKYDDVIVGYNAMDSIKISGIHDSYFSEWFFANMKNTVIVTTFMMLIGLFQYFLFYQRLKNNQFALTTVNAELVSKNNEIEKRLYFDPLTGLPNRTSLQKDVDDMKKPKIVIMDIDDFRKMNNYFGLRICNQILLYLTDLVKKIAQKENMKVYRVGPDQFAFVEDGDFFIDRYEDFALDLLESLKGLIIDVERGVDDKQDLIEVHCTIGFCLDDVNTLRKAMVALEFAKRSGKDYFCYFKSIDDTVEYVEQIKRSNLIRDAIVNDKIIPYYQPIFNAQKQVMKYETLMRIQNSHEVVSPHIFLEVSKRIKRYVDIEKMLMEKSFKLLHETPDAIISVNLSGRDMTDGDMSVFIIDRINRYKVANRVVFEILEDENVENVERVSKFIERVKRMGAKIAIDDFGSGYSNFSYILKLKPDYIKIDGSIIKNIDTDDDSRSVASAIIAFAKRLNITVIAEFVHSKSVFETCVALGIDEFQGFYLAEPSQTLF